MCRTERRLTVFFSRCKPVNGLLFLHGKVNRKIKCKFFTNNEIHLVSIPGEGIPRNRNVGVSRPYLQCSVTHLGVREGTPSGIITTVDGK